MEFQEFLEKIKKEAHKVVANANSPYEGLHGEITEIRSGEEKETENEVELEIVVDFEEVPDMDTKYSILNGTTIDQVIMDEETLNFFFDDGLYSLVEGKVVKLQENKNEETKDVKFAQLWNEASDAMYNPEATANILKSFNMAISALYAIEGENEYIFSMLNTSSYAEKAYESIEKSIGVDLACVANKLELMRNVLFGDCLDWNNIHKAFEKYSKEEK